MIIAYAVLGGIIIHKEGHLSWPFKVRSSKIQVTRPYFYK